MSHIFCSNTHFLLDPAYSERRKLNSHDIVMCFFVEDCTPQGNLLLFDPPCLRPHDPDNPEPHSRLFLDLTMIVGMPDSKTL